jgi:hypothetical protein
MFVVALNFGYFFCCSYDYWSAADQPYRRPGAVRGGDESGSEPGMHRYPVDVHAGVARRTAGERATVRGSRPEARARGRAAGRRPRAW